MAIDESQSEHPPLPMTHRVQGVLIALALTLCATLPLILSGNASGRAAADDYNYHWIAIQKFAIEWPSPDLSDYRSATSPGYHLVLAPVVRSGFGHMGTQLFAMGWTLAFFGLLCWVVTRSMGRWGALMCLPFIASMYTLFPGVWLLPDNAGWFLVLSVLLLSLRDRSHWLTWFAAGLLLLPLIMMRQIHVWVAGVVWMSAWIGSGDRIPTDLRSLFDDWISRSGRTMIAIACTIPAFALLGWFVLLWGGLVPPMFQDDHQDPNLATPGFILMQVGVMSLFFLPVLLPRWKACWAHHWRWVIVTVLIGCVCALFPVSSYSIDAGRYSGWWNFIDRVPTILDRSPVYILGAILGSLAIPVWVSMCTRRDAWVWIGAFIAFTLAQSANHASWQRYHEPMLLMMMVLILSRSHVIRVDRVRVLVGVSALSVLLGILMIKALVSPEPYIPIENPFETQAQLDSNPINP